MEHNLKEVYFGTYCETCKYKEKPEQEEPCSTCLANPGAEHSHKPVKYEQK